MFPFPLIDIVVRIQCDHFNPLFFWPIASLLNYLVILLPVDVVVRIQCDGLLFLVFGHNQELRCLLGDLLSYKVSLLNQMPPWDCFLD